MSEKIPGFDRYRVTRDGRVFSMKPSGPRELRPYDNGSGYLLVVLSVGGAVHRRYVHRLVTEAYHGACPAGQEARHVNGNRRDNRAENLTWGTRVENAADRSAHGAMGKRRHLTPAEKAEARALLGTVSNRAIARRFKVSPTTIWRIAKGERA